MCQGVTQEQSVQELHKLRLLLEHELLCGDEAMDEQRANELRESVDWVCERLSSELGLKQVTPQTIAATVPLLQDKDAAIRQHAASTLSILASRSVFNQFRIGSEPGVISSLVSMLQDCETWVRGSAAAALSHLAMHSYSTMQTRIGQEPGAISALVQLLQDRDAGLGCAAALALKTLAENHPKNQTLIGQAPGAFSGLVALLYGADSALQTMAHVAMKRLARNHPVNRAKIRHVVLGLESQWQLEL